MNNEKPLVYILDDDPDFLAIFQLMLAKLGFETQTFTKEPELIEGIKKHKPGLCFIDINLHGFASGYPLVQSLHKKYGKELTLFVVSAQSGSVAISHAVELGATDYIMKPVDSTILASKLQKFFITDGTREESLSFLEHPQGIEARLLLDLKVLEVDELGIGFESSHLLSKGSVFYLKEDSFEFLKGSGDQLMSVSSNEAFEGSIYRGYAEFGSASEELLLKVRTWIQNNR